MGGGEGASPYARDGDRMMDDGRATPGAGNKR
jgi:hypothetical protein